MLVGVNTLVLRGTSAGGVSVVQAGRFLGASAAPAVFLGPYHLSPVAGFGLAALVLLAAGSWSPGAIARGYDRVQELHRAMDDGRRQRLARLGFPPDEAAELSALHTRNFM